MTLIDGRSVCRVYVQACHIQLARATDRLSRIELFLLIYTLHMVVPLIGLGLFIYLPWTRLAIILMVCATVVIQFVTKTCPIVKLENAIMPSATRVTWSTANIFEYTGITVNNKIRFWWMITCTVVAALSLIAMFIHLDKCI